jgi:hypothetical protein
VIVRITALAELDDRPGAAADTHARASAGDTDHAWLLDEWQEGRLVLARVNVVVAAEDERGAPHEARGVIENVWLQPDAPPVVEEQVAAAAPREVHALADRLHEADHPVTGKRLDGFYVHVELGDRLRRALAGA